MKKLLSDFLSLIFPEVCPGCNQPLVSGESILCISCEMDLPIINRAPQIENIFSGRVNLSAIRVYLKFYSEGITQHLLHEIKYNGNKDLGQHLGEELMNFGDNTEVFQDVDLVIPVPLHQTKLKQRGYNQSLLLAEGMAKVLNKPVNTSSIVRMHKSDTQTRKNRAERWENVSGIFEAVNKDLEGKHVLLVDDVLTTGATLEACAQAALASGCRSISVAALAVAM